MSWMDELEDDVSEVEESMNGTSSDDEEVSEFEQQFRSLVEAGEVENVNVMVLKEEVGSISDVELLKDARNSDERTTAKKFYRNRLAELDDSDEGDEEETEEEEVEEEEVDSEPEPEPEPEPESEPEPEPEPEEEIEDEQEEAEEQEEEPEPEPEPEPEEDEEEEDSSDDWGGILDDDDDDEEQEEQEETSETSEEPDEEEEVEVDAGVETGVQKMGQEEEEPEPEPEPTSEPTSTDNTEMPEVDVSNIAPNAMTREQAEEKERRQGILVWGEPGMGKTHFAYTMPAPVCLIDTEGKGNDIAHKFDKEVYIWQPNDYDGAVEALEEAFEVLKAYKQQADVLGTIVVDSMSIMWDWSQQKYVEFAYPTKDDASEVKFSSNMGKGGESDWKQIKRYHNTKFRQRIIDSPFHFAWTQMRGDDYAAVMEGESSTPPDKPVGEKNNPYKANYILRIDEGPEGAPVGNLQKSALTKHNYVGLKYPTFEKHQALLEAIDAVETGAANEEIADVEAKYNVRIIDGNPQYKEE